MKKKKNKPIVKICSRCKKERPLNDFKHEKKEMLFGSFLWIYPWCNDCSLEVKTKWGVNWIGGTKSGKQKRKNTNTISSISRRGPNKKMHIQRVERTVSESVGDKHLPSESTQRRADPVRNKRGPGRIIETLKKTKDYKESI